MMFLLAALLVMAYLAASIFATRQVVASREIERRQKVILVGAAWLLPFVGAGLVWSANRSGLLGDLPRFNHDPYVQSEMADIAESRSLESSASDGSDGSDGN